MISAIVVDDEPAVAIIINKFIESGKLPIEIAGTARDGRRALELIAAAKPGLVFLDIQMPVMNGFEVMAAAPECRYIIITAFESFEYARQALRLGARDILLKPIDYGQLLQSIARATGWQFTANETVNEILEYIHGHYAEKISLNDLASLSYASPSHVARLFKKHMGASIVTYLTQLRIQKAKELLERGEGKIKEVSEQVGFCNLNYFYKCFKALTGETPADFANKSRQQP